MDRHTRRLDIFTKKMVKGKCNIKNYHDIHDTFAFSVCGRCPFLADRESPEDMAVCGWYEYKTLIKKSSSETDDDEYGGMPSTLYEWIIECASCGNDIRFTSGNSTMWYGDNNKCRRCGLDHYYLKYGKESKDVIFAVPIKDYDKLHQEKNKECI